MTLPDPEHLARLSDECEAARLERKRREHKYVALSGEVWIFRYDPPPIPVRDYDWSAAHEDYDGPEDGRLFWGETPADIAQEIDSCSQVREMRRLTDHLVYCLAQKTFTIERAPLESLLLRVGVNPW